MNRKLVSQGLYHFIALLLTAVTLLPFFWMLSTSLKTYGAIMALPIQWIPKNPTFQNYADMFQKDGLAAAMANSLIVSASSVLVTVASSAMAAFAFAKLNFRGKNAIFLVYLATMMIPSQVLFIPLYLLMGELRLVDSLSALVLPGIFKVFAVFMLRQGMMTISNVYLEAPAMDGAGLFTVFGRIICPMCKSSFATLAVICFMDAWNDYLLPLVMLTTKQKFTLPIILSSLSGQYKSEYNLLMAGALISMLPILAVYTLAQKYFASGLQVGGVKG
jgi:multiple sugar transport system permease protein